MTRLSALLWWRSHPDPVEPRCPEPVRRARSSATPILDRLLPEREEVE